MHALTPLHTHTHPHARTHPPHSHNSPYSDKVGSSVSQSNVAAVAGHTSGTAVQGDHLNIAVRTQETCSTYNYDRCLLQSNTVAVVREIAPRVNCAHLLSTLQIVPLYGHTYICVNIVVAGSIVLLASMASS